MAKNKLHRHQSFRSSKTTKLQIEERETN